MNTNQEKYKFADSILNTGSSIYIHLNPKAYGVKVPMYFMQQDKVILQFGYNMAVAIPDLQTDIESISGTLSFKYVPFHCNVPWGAVYLISDESYQGRIWDKDVPASVIQDLENKNKQNVNTNLFPIKNSDKEKFSKTKKIKRELPPYLKVIK